MFELKQLKETLGEKTAERNEISEVVRSENRVMTENEITRFDSIDNEISTLETQIKTAERLEKSKFNGVPSVVRSVSRTNKPITRQDHNCATKAWLLTQAGGQYKHLIQDNWLDCAERCAYDVNASELILRDTLSNGQDSQTQYAGAEALDGSLVQGIMKRLVSFGGVRSVASVVNTSNGSPLHWVVSDDTGNAATIVGENTNVTSVAVAYDKVSLGAFSYKSNVYPVSLELIQDSQIDIVADISDNIGTRLARRQNLDLTTGTGTTLPFGVSVRATTGVTAASTTAITYTELNNLYRSLDPAYRDNACWMMSDTTAGYLELNIKDQNNRPLWMPGETYASSPYDKLKGKPVIINNQMPAQTAGLRPILFGDFSKYKVRQVAPITLTVLKERFAEYYAVGIVAFSRMDGNLIDVNSVKALQMHAAS